jgi:hypothetical protein
VARAEVLRPLVQEHNLVKITGMASEYGRIGYLKVFVYQKRAHVPFDASRFDD